MGGDDKEKFDAVTRMQMNPGRYDRMTSEEAEEGYQKWGEQYDPGIKNREGSLQRDHRIYDKKELERVMDALRRIGIFEMAQPPEYLGRRYMPVRYVLPSLPENMMPEDILRAF